MKSKIALISTGVLLSAGIGMHAARYCPLQHLKASVQHTAPAPAAPTAAEAKPGTVVLR